MLHLQDHHRYLPEQIIQQLLSSIYRSAILDTDCFCCSFIINFSDACTDSCTYFFSLLCCSCLTCSDCPDWLVSDNCCLSLICCDILESNFNLLTDEIHCYTLFSLLKSFSTAHDRCNTMLECFQNFFINCLHLSQQSILFSRNVRVTTYLTPASASIFGEISPV